MGPKRVRRKSSVALTLLMLFCVLELLPIPKDFLLSQRGCLRTRYVMAEAGDYSSFFEEKDYLRKGSKGKSVSLLQGVLKELGFYTHQVDGIFGTNTEKALLGFQSSQGLSKDGILGPVTRKALGKSYLQENPPKVHKVQSGETLSVVAEKYGLSVLDLISINRLKNPDMIYVGQTLKLVVPEVSGNGGGGTPEGENDSPKPPEKDEGKSQDASPAPLFPVPDKRICLSFDDGPDPSTTPVILDILDRYGIKATFFLIGQKAEKYPEIAKAIMEKGHTLGVHGYEHKTLAGLDRKEVRADLSRAQESLKKACGSTPRLYRPPGGFLDQTQIEEALRLGMTSVMWTNIGGADLAAKTKDEVVERIVKASKDGGIILLHEGPVQTIEALPQIIENLARLGFGFQNPTSP